MPVATITDFTEWYLLNTYRDMMTRHDRGYKFSVQMPDMGNYTKYTLLPHLVSLNHRYANICAVFNVHTH